MRTIRNNVFETNSSSIHCVTILSDKEYQDVKDGKAVISGDSYFKITLGTIKEYIEDEISSSKHSIENYHERMKNYKSLLEKDTGDWTESEKGSITWSYDHYNGSELKKLVEGRIQECENNIKDAESLIKDYESLDAKKLLNYVKDIIIPNLEEIKDSDENPSCFNDIEEKYIEPVRSFSEDFDNIETYGQGYENDEDTRSVEGIKIHVLSYYGCDG